MSKGLKIRNSQTEFLIYKSSNGNVKIDVLIQNENIWLPQKKIAELFGVDRSVITKHLKNIFISEELEEKTVCAKIAHTADDGKTKTFFATIQNKLHFAITGNTAAEIILDRVNHKKENMGLTSWKFCPNGPIRKTDVSVAKNYLNEKELDFLNRIVSMYLDYAEDQAKRKIPMTMQDWESKLNAFLKFNEREILSGSGKITTEIAKAFTENEFEIYRVIQDRAYKSDFDKLLEEQEKLLC